MIGTGLAFEMWPAGGGLVEPDTRPNWISAYHWLKLNELKRRLDLGITEREIKASLEGNYDALIGIICAEKPPSLDIAIWEKRFEEKGDTGANSIFFEDRKRYKQELINSGQWGGSVPGRKGKRGSMRVRRRFKKK